VDYYALYKRDKFVLVPHMVLIKSVKFTNFLYMHMPSGYPLYAILIVAMWIGFHLPVLMMKIEMVDLY
jgi:hypothetical protein